MKGVRVGKKDVEYEGGRKRGKERMKSGTRGREDEVWDERKRG